MGLHFTRVVDDPTEQRDALTFDAEHNEGFRVLAINTGSTSTKVAVYREMTPELELSLSHTKEDLKPFATVFDQEQWRRDLVLNALKEKGIALESLSAVIGRGGLLRPIESGVYRVNEKMLAELKAATPQHASGLAAGIAKEIAKECGVEAYIADPIVVDERDEVAKVCGIKGLDTRVIWHALNQKATARLYAKECGKPYEELNLIVAHMGGGITVGAHKGGRVIDCNNGLDGSGPIAPERAGTLPAGSLVKLCFSGKHTEKEVLAMIAGGGGLVSLAGTNQAREVAQRAAEGDAEADLAIRAMIYSIAKQIGQLATVLYGKVDAVILTGGIAHNTRVVTELKERCSFIAPVVIYPGENELESLVQNALRVLHGEENAKDY